MELRDYQIAASDACVRSLASAESTLLLMATGTGKTQTAVDVIRRVPGRTLFLAHREELINQASERLWQMLGYRPDVEKAEYRDTRQAATLVASVQTMCRPDRLARHHADEFSLVVVDEVHHAAANSYTRILEHFTGAKRLGLTATATRSDGRKLGEFFEDVAYTYDLRDAIRDGWLVPIKRRMVRVSSLRLDGIDVRGGDLVAGQVEARVLEDEATVHAWAIGILEQSGDRKTLAFTPGVESSRRLAEILNRYQPGSAVHLDGETPVDRRRAELARYARGEYRILCNVALFTEGYDEPAISCIANCAPTQSHTRYVQRLGRGTRLAEGKADLLVIDFTTASTDFDLVTAVDILGDNEEAEVRRGAEREMEEDPDCDVGEALDRARSKYQAAQLEMAQRQAEARAAARRSGVRATGDVRVFDLDDVGGILGVNAHQVRAVARRFGAKALSEKQIAWAKRSGIAVPDSPTSEQTAQIRAILNQMSKRIQAGLCTWKQKRTLEKNGLPGEVSMGVAKMMLDELAANRWRLTPARRAELVASVTEQGGLEDGE